MSKQHTAAQCRTDGRCQYAIDHGAEGLGHCPQGRCCMPGQFLIDALEDAIEFIAGCEDVVDGPYGEPRPNEAMLLVRELREVVHLAMLEK
jgi:hypothetical protein